MKHIFLSLLAVILIIEEWLWDALTRLGHYLATWLRLERFDSWLRETSPYMALLAFLIPVIVIAPFNLLALWCFIHHMVTAGLVIEIMVKLSGTLLVARVFALTKSQLLTFHWFSVMYNTITGWLHWAHEAVAHTYVYQAAKRLKQGLKEIAATWLNILR